MIETRNEKRDTRGEMEREVAACRSLFEKKTRDYGTSWRIMRLPSLTDQIFIKANRIRSVQESGENRVGDGLRGEFVAMVNYCVMALIQCEMLDTNRETALADEDLAAHFTRLSTQMSVEEALSLYDWHIERVLKLMLDKNHDYGEAWRKMRTSSITDIILMKLLRIKQIEDHNGKTIISEGLDANYYDIINYAVFALIQLDEQKQ